jgi:hypothetical protein
MRKRKPKRFEPKIPSPKMWDAPPPTGKERSQKQEARLSKGMGFKPTINSGSLPSIWQKEDAFDEDFQVQMKTTTGRDARIVDRRVLFILSSRAYELGRDPLLLLTFEDADMPMPEDWAMVPVDVLKALLETKRDA